MRIETGAKVEGASASDSGVSVSFNGEEEEFDFLAIATGRAPDVEGLGLEEAGVERDDRGLVKVDGRLRTSREGIWAIGDMVPGPALAHKASDEGIIAVEDSAGHEVHEIDYNYIPAVTFCHPQVASFGLTEKAAREAGHDVVVGKVPMGALGAPTVYGAGQDRRRQALRRDPRRPHLLGAGGRPHPGARQRPRAGGRLPRGRPRDPSPSGVRRDRHGGGPGDGWVVDPRVRLAGRALPEPARATA